MRMHPVISFFLAVWFALGGTLIPRFSCVCANGTVSVEIGHQFCCDAEDSCSDSCSGSTTGAITEPRGSGVGASSCSDGCQSTLIEDEVIGISERECKGDSEDQPPSAQAHWLDSNSSARAVVRRVARVARPPDLRLTSIHQLRSVILLV